MLKIIKDLISTRKAMIKKLENEVEDLKDKLQKRQEDINKTNAYWKKKLHNLSQKKNG